MEMINVVYKWVLRLLMPKEAERMEKDGVLDMPTFTGDMPAAEDYLEVFDQGADITVFAYSGLDAMFAGQPRFEFRGIFRRLKPKCNLVCFRDLRRLCFHVAPGGSMAGLEFYEKETRRIMAELGSTFNVSLGSSSGGQAAFYFATKCGMDKVIAFGPAFPHSVYVKPVNALRTFLNLKLMVLDPGAYIELCIVTIAAIWADRALLKTFKDKRLIWNTLQVYRDAGDGRPLAAVFYGEHSVPDVRQAKIMAEFPQVKLIPVDTNRHNSPTVLLKRGELKRALAAELQFGEANLETCEAAEKPPLDATATERSER